MASIFVSHSSLDLDLTKEVCKALASPTSAGGPQHSTFVDFEVLVDYDKLVTGQAWPSQLHEWLSRCHAGLILLTPAAVRSPWVLKEATILAWRFAEEKPKFPLFFVLYPGVSADDLKREKFDPLDLGIVQRILATDPADIAAEIQRVLPPQSERTQYERLEGRLKDLFDKLGVNTLVEVADKLCPQPLGFPPEAVYKPLYLAAVARRLICGELGQYSGLEELAGDLSLSDAKGAVDTILDIVAPSWVDLTAAGKLPRVLTASPRRAAALNGALPDFTAKMYVRRAHPLNLGYQTVIVRGGAKGDPAAHYTRQLCAWFRDRKLYDGTDADIIKALVRRKLGIYAVLPEPVDNASLLTLLKRFERITFLLWTGEELTRDETLTSVDWIEPTVHVEHEQTAADDYRAARAIVAAMSDT